MEYKEYEQQLNRLQQQYLCCFPVRQINWKDLTKSISWQQQEQLIKCTYQHRLNKKYPIKYAYQLSFLKHLISVLEKDNTEVHDTIYCSYCTVLTLVKESNYAYKHYLLPAYNVSITLHESNLFVTEGTTGLCSWQASLALADYLLHNRETVEGKNILELGAGTGLCGIIVKSCLNPNEVLLTDGSVECIQLMRENISLNFNKGSSAPKSSLLLWDDVRTFDWTQHLQTNLLLGADIVYNEAHFSALIDAIDFVFTNCGNQVMLLLSVTVRNEQTLKRFTEQLVKLNFLTEDCAVILEGSSHLHWDRTSPVRILKVERSISLKTTNMHFD